MNLPMKKSGGYMLVEILIAIVIFAVGLLGMANSMSKSMHISMDNNARAMALTVASQAMEPLYIAARNVAVGTAVPADFVAALSSVANKKMTGNGGKDTFTLNILQALDEANNDVLVAATIQPPVRVVVEVSYTGVESTKKTKANYTFVW